jgi:hypothetical protein
LFEISFQRRNHFICRIEWTGSVPPLHFFQCFLKSRVNSAPLRRSVLVLGIGKLGPVDGCLWSQYDFPAFEDGFDKVAFTRPALFLIRFGIVTWPFS